MLKFGEVCEAVPSRIQIINGFKLNYSLLCFCSLCVCEYECSFPLCRVCQKYNKHVFCFVGIIHACMQFLCTSGEKEKEKIIICGIP